MTSETLRRSNWTANELPPRRSQFEGRPGGQEDPLAELERIVMRGDPFGESARPAETQRVETQRAETPRVETPRAETQRAPMPSNVELFPRRREIREERPPLRLAPDPEPRAPAAEPRIDDIFGVDEAAFEAALRAPPAPAPVRPAAPIAAEPRFTEIDVATFDAEFAALRPSLDPVRAAEPAPQAAPARLDSDFLRGLDRELFGKDQTPDQPAVFMESPIEPVESELEQEPIAEETRPRRGSGVVTVAAVLGLVALGVGGAVGFTMVTGGARSPAGEPVVVRADDRPTRIVAQAAEDPNKVIQDRLTAAERVVSREEEPVQALTPPARPEPRVPLPSAGPQGAEPRRVTTTTIRVRPDGTMESEPTRPILAAGLAQQPAGSPRPAQELAAAPPITDRDTPTNLSAAAIPVPPARPERAVAPPAAAAPPAQQPAQPTRLASADPAPVRGGGPLVQISSQPSDEAARQSIADLQRRFPQLIGGRATNVRAATVGERTIHRVRVGGFGSQNEATQFCQRLRSAGGDCFVVPN